MRTLKNNDSTTNCEARLIIAIFVILHEKLAFYSFGRHEFPRIIKRNLPAEHLRTHQSCFLFHMKTNRINCFA